MLVSIDPGAKLAGVALWDDNELTCAWLTRGEDWRDTALNVSREVHQRIPRLDDVDVAIERPQVYVQSKQKGDPNDLITIALMAGGAASLTATGLVTVYLPREWKQSVPKEIMVRRIQARLTSEERARVELPAPSLAHNVWDAVGIGLHQLKRRGR